MAEITKITNASLASPEPPPNFQTTGLTAGEALGQYDACYIDSTGKVKKATGAVANAAAAVRGWTPKAHSLGDKFVTLYHGDINVNYGSGLTPGTELYLSGATAGGLADAASTGGTRKLGFVLDATRVRLFSIQGN